MNAGRRNTRNANLGVRLRTLQQSVTGHTYKPRPDPTPFVTVPWNTWTYSKTGTIDADDQPSPTITPYTTTIGDIATQIKDANGIGAVAPVVKVLRAAAWITANQPNGLITPSGTTAFYELSGYDTTDKSKREIVSDQGTLNMPATFGYVFPIVDQKEILDAATSVNQPVMATTTEGLVTDQKVQCNHRIHVLWKAKNNLFTASEQLLEQN
jgi:hypothetical protein